VIDAALLQPIAGREPRLPTADHDHGVVLGHLGLGSRIARRVLLELEHRDRLEPFTRAELARRALDRSELVERRAATKAVTRGDALRSDVQGLASPLQKVRNGILAAHAQVFFDDVGR